jgi:hypothetical protein
MVSRYSQSFLVRAATVGEAVAIVRNDVEEAGAILLLEGPAEEIRLHQIPLMVLPAVLLRRDHGVVWRSGRVFYPDEQN